MEKCMQLYSIQTITHGVMMVGPVGTGKSAVWTVLLQAMTVPGSAAEAPFEPTKFVATVRD